MTIPRCQADDETVLDKDVFSGLDQIAARQAADEAVAADPKAAANTQALEAVFVLQNDPIGRFYSMVYYKFQYINICIYWELTVSIDQYVFQP